MSDTPSVLSPVVPAPATPPTLDPFSPELLRVSQDFGATLGVTEVLTTVPIRKPSKSIWVRARPEPEFSIDTTVIELKDQRGEIYLVAPQLREELAAEPCMTIKRLLVAIDSQRVLSLWPLNLPRPDGQLDDWSRSALRAAELAKLRWVRVIPDIALGAYRVQESSAIPDPVWPDLSMQQVLAIAFRDRYIATLDHPVLQRLRGAA